MFFAWLFLGFGLYNALFLFFFYLQLQFDSRVCVPPHLFGSSLLILDLDSFNLSPCIAIRGFLCYFEDLVVSILTLWRVALVEFFRHL